jgi:hypothetical protein
MVSKIWRARRNYLLTAAKSPGIAFSKKKGELSLTLLFHQGASTDSSLAESFFKVGYLGYSLEYFGDNY